ncbi:hypothetical protein [Nesterenkonia populi]|uniref:hypothetical protein n=1 Tax=Nesterenkonia populi TaxID=1591087 RepID=UPI0011BF6918|nr:hypothetical protein [Nesterenkonia populi]
MVKPKEKVAHVYEAKLLSKGSSRRLKSRDWNRTLREFKEEYPLKERKLNGVLYDPIEVNGTYLLGVHKPVDGSFMTQLDESSASVKDLMMDDEEEGNAYYSSAVLFSETKHIFMIASGGTSAPQANALEPFLQHFFPGAESEYWKVGPYMDRPQIDRLREAKGLVSFSSRFSTHRDLFSLDEPSEGPAGYADRIADAVGQDVEIEIKIKLPKEARGQQTMRKFLNLVTGDLKRTITEKSKTRAEAVIDEELTEELSLVAHKMATKFELNAVGPERRLYSDLLNGLVEISPEINQRIRELEQG